MRFPLTFPSHHTALNRIGSPGRDTSCRPGDDGGEGAARAAPAAPAAAVRTRSASQETATRMLPSPSPSLKRVWPARSASAVSISSVAAVTSNRFGRDQPHHGQRVVERRRRFLERLQIELEHVGAGVAAGAVGCAQQVDPHAVDAGLPRDLERRPEHRPAAVQHLVRGLGVDMHVELGIARGIAVLGIERSRHQHDLLDAAHDVRLLLKGDRQVGLRPQQHDGLAVGLGRGQDLDQRLDRRSPAAVRAVGNGRAADAVLAVDVLDGAPGAGQRLLGAAEDGNLRLAGQGDQRRRIARGAVDADITGDRRDGADLQLRRRAGQENGERVVDPRIGVDDDRSSSGHGCRTAARRAWEQGRARDTCRYRRPASPPPVPACPPRPRGRPCRRPRGRGR